MFSFLGKKPSKHCIFAPVTGLCIPLSAVKDVVFASEMMGKGVAFLCDSEYVYAPCDGTICMIAQTLHAFGIRNDDGLEIIVHVGLDTVELKGEGFELLTRIKKKVKVGTPILHINQELMKEKKVDLTTPLVIVNHDQFSLEFMDILHKHVAGRMDKIISYKKL